MVVENYKHKSITTKIRVIFEVRNMQIQAATIQLTTNATLWIISSHFEYLDLQLPNSKYTLIM